MSTIRCSIEGCQEVFTTAEPVSLLAKFTCRYHSRKIQIEASARTYDPLKDHADEAEHFDLWQGWKRYNSFKKLRKVVAVIDGSEGLTYSTSASLNIHSGSEKAAIQMQYAPTAYQARAC